MVTPRASSMDMTGIGDMHIFVPYLVTCTSKWLLTSRSKCLATHVPPSSVEKEAKTCPVLKWLGVKPKTRTPLSPSSMEIRMKATPGEGFR